MISRFRLGSGGTPVPQTPTQHFNVSVPSRPSTGMAGPHPSYLMPPPSTTTIRGDFTDSLRTNGRLIKETPMRRSPCYSEFADLTASCFLAWLPLTPRYLLEYGIPPRSSNTSSSSPIPSTTTKSSSIKTQPSIRSRADANGRHGYAPASARLSTATARTTAIRQYQSRIWARVPRSTKFRSATKATKPTTDQS
jgi:hypothetical protein